MTKKIFMENEVLRTLVERAGLFSSDSNAQVTFTFGCNISPSAFLNTMSIVAGTEQFISTFTTPIPKDYEAQYTDESKTVLVSYLEETFKVSDFLSTVGALIGLGEMLFLKKTDNGLLTVGAKDNSVELQLEALANDQKAMPIMVDRTKSLANVVFAVPEFLNALRIGGCMVHKDSEDTKGLGNVLLSMEYEGKENAASKGIIKVYSSDGNCLSRGECDATFMEDTTTHTNLVDYLAKNEWKNFKLGVPKKSQLKLLKLLKGVENCTLIATDKHVSVLLDQGAMFTFVVGANIKAVSSVANIVDNIQKTPKAVKVVCDNEAIKGKIDILNNVAKAKKCKNALLLTLTDKLLTMEISGKKDMGTVKVALSSSKLESGTKVKVYFNGDNLAAAISSMKKGNVTISSGNVADYIKEPVQFTTGDDDACSKEIVLLAPLRGPKDNEETGTEALEEA